MTKASNKNELFTLRNVGEAVFKDLEILGISNIKQLSNKNPDDMFQELQKITSKKHDICSLDVFSAIVHEAKTGEKTPWWQWSKVRKSKIK